jgi:hypothetical protein
MPFIKQFNNVKSFIFQDVALLSIANVLHRAGFLNDAIVAASYSMDLSPGLVVGHFNMANLYAAKVN